MDLKKFNFLLKRNERVKTVYSLFLSFFFFAILTLALGTIDCARTVIRQVGKRSARPTERRRSKNRIFLREKYATRGVRRSFYRREHRSKSRERIRLSRERDKYTRYSRVDTF